MRRSQPCGLADVDGLARDLSAVRSRRGRFAAQYRSSAAATATAHDQLPPEEPNPNVDWSVINAFLA